MEHIQPVLHLIGIIFQPGLYNRDEAILKEEGAKRANVFGLSTVSNPQEPLREADHLSVKLKGANFGLQIQHRHSDQR